MEGSEKVTETTFVRLHVDLTLNTGFDATMLRELGRGVEIAVVEHHEDALSIERAQVTQIVPAEGERFDWQGQ